MRLISWNVNGLRAIYRKGDWAQFLKTEPFDILCLQETKADKEKLPPDLQDLDGHHGFFASSRVKKGYSGVTTYSKIEPESVDYGMNIDRFDKEGRLVTLHFKDFSLLNVYFPNGGSGPERLQYKLDFYDAFLVHIERLRTEGRKIIFCGDINTAHEDIDLARPKENEENSGFLPEERAWVDEVISHGYVDTFRHIYPDKKDMYTYWDMFTHARERNVGWRIDYFFVDPSLVSRIKKVSILSHIYGSDHCPIELSLN